MKKYKSFFPYAVALVLTYFGFLCLTIPYLKELIFFNINLPFDNIPVSEYPFYITGFNALSLWNRGWTGIFVSIFQIIELTVMTGILIYAMAGIFSELLAKAKDREANPVLHFIMLILTVVNLSVDFLVLVFLIIMSVVNHYSLNAGMFLKLFLDVSAVVGLLLGKYFFSEKPLITARPLSAREEKPKNAENASDKES